MPLLAYIGYGVLVFFALVWTLGVRIKPVMPPNAIFGAMFYVAAVIILPIADISLMHSWWLILGGLVFSLMAIVILSVPLLGRILVLLAAVFATVVRFGSR